MSHHPGHGARSAAPCPCCTPSKPADDRLVSIQDAAALWGVSTRTMRRFVSSSVVEAVRIGPRTIRIRVRDLEAAPRPIPAAIERAS